MDTGIDRIFGFMAPPQNIPIVDFNFGQRPFSHQPAGTVALQTQNLPAATIRNGRDHFQAITGGGSGALLYEENSANTGVTAPFDPISPGVAFPHNGVSPQWVIDFGQAQDSVSTTHGGAAGLTCCLSEDGNTWTVFSTNFTLPSGSAATFTTADNGGNQIRFVRFFFVGGFSIDWQSTPSGVPILQAAQDVFDTGLWWIKDINNSNQHQLVDSVRGAGTAFTCPGSLTANYAAPAGNSVAWCWNFDNANPAANGFEIITYTGNDASGATTQNIPHRLGGVPDFFITFRTGDTANARTPWVWHGSAPVAQQRLQLNDSLAGSVLTNFWGQPTATDLVMGPGDNTNANNFDYLVYLWRAVPGYSAFGSYQGNNDPDGPFIYTGFRPAFVMYKNIDTTGNWIIHDTTRDTANPINLRLVSNTTNSEGTSTSMNVDILSNGFKQRNQDQDLNTSHTYIYAAFAENPFQSPVTAR